MALKQVGVIAIPDSARSSFDHGAFGDGAFSFMIRDNTREDRAEPARRRSGLAS